MTDKIDAVGGAEKTQNKQSMNNEDMQEQQTKEHFTSSMDGNHTSISPAFDVVDPKSFGVEEVPVMEKNPIVNDESVTSQSSGSATDQENKKNKQGKGDDEVEGVGAAKSKSQAGETRSLMDEVGGTQKSFGDPSKVSLESIKTQSKSLSSQIDQVKNKLSQVKNAEIKPAYQTALRNKLTHVDDNLKIALNKAGVEHHPPAPVAEGGKANPIEKFVGYLNNSQSQLDSLNSTIDKMNVTGAQLSPANMMAIQMKMGYAQQQIELFTSLLNKALESIKTVMNVQV